jgi:hypothetical protein
MIQFQSKTAVFDNLGDGRERQDDDVRASEMQANLDEQPPAPRVEGIQSLIRLMGRFKILFLIKLTLVKYHILVP